VDYSAVFGFWCVLLSAAKAPASQYADGPENDCSGHEGARHTGAEFVDFLAQIVVSQPAGREIHVIADNLSVYKTKKVFEFLEANPTVRIPPLSFHVHNTFNTSSP